MRTHPSVSLIISTYNWPDALELCLQSVQQQRLLPNEVIIADDGSSKETALVIERFQKRLLVPLHHIWHPDEGFRLGMIRNKAMAAASSEYLIQVDGDLVLHQDFVYDHVHAAKKGYFIGGSRVLFGEAYSKEVLQKRQLNFSFFQKGINNRANAIHFPAAARLIGSLKKTNGLYNLRGCNMSFWKQDIVSVNGYNEEISGWGREDTELVIRLYNKGVKRRFFKLQGIVYHIYHPEYDRSTLVQNDKVVQSTMTQKLTWCEKGINQYL